MKWTVFLLALLAASPALAQTPVCVAQPDGSCGRPSLSSDNELIVDPSANTSVTGFEWCPGVAVTTMTAAQTLDGRKDITFVNKSAVEVSIGFDATNPTSTGSTGFPLEASSKTPVSFGYGSNIAVKAVAPSALSTPACVWVQQAK